MKKIHYLEEIEIQKEAESLNNSEKKQPQTNPIRANLDNFIKIKAKSIKKDFL